MVQCLELLLGQYHIDLEAFVPPGRLHDYSGRKWWDFSGLIVPIRTYCWTCSVCCLSLLGFSSLSFVSAFFASGFFSSAGSSPPPVSLRISALPHSSSRHLSPQAERSIYPLSHQWSYRAAKYRTHRQLVQSLVHHSIGFTRIFARIPSSSVSRVIVALSVWISHKASPGFSSSPMKTNQNRTMIRSLVSFNEPSFLSHRTIVPSLIVGEREGIFSGVVAKWNKQFIDKHTEVRGILPRARTASTVMRSIRRWRQTFVASRLRFRSIARTRNWNRISRNRVWDLRRSDQPRCGPDEIRRNAIK